MDDSNGRFGDVFRSVVEDLGAVWGQIGEHDGEQLADEALSLIVGDRYGVCDELVMEAAPALGAAGLAALARRAKEAMAGAPQTSEACGHDWSKHQLRQILSDVADAQGDVDAFISVQSGGEIRYADALAIAFAASIGATREAEALCWLDQAVSPPSRAQTSLSTTAPARQSPPDGPTLWNRSGNAFGSMRWSSLADGQKPRRCVGDCSSRPCPLACSGPICGRFRTSRTTRRWTGRSISRAGIPTPWRLSAF